MAAVLQRHPVRTTAYAVMLVLLAAFYALRFAAFATPGEAAYGLALVLAAAFALVAGALALQQFLAVRRDAFLLVSAGLWVAAALHLYHFAAFAGVLGSAESTVATASALRGALLPTLFFSLFLCLSLLANRQDRPSAAQPGGVFLAAATLAFIVTVAALVFPLPQAASVVFALGQPLAPLTAQLDLLLAATLALLGIGASLRSGRWRTDPFSRWVLLTLVITLLALARLPLVYAWPSELLLLFGHALVLASYVCVAVGIVSKATAGAPAAEAVRAATPAAARDAPEPSPLSRAAEDTPVPAPALALRDLQASHRALRNATKGLLIGVRGDGTITDWKPAAEFGPTALPSDLLGKNIRAVLPLDQADAIMATVARVLQAGKTERLQYAAADGSMALEGYVTAHSADHALCIIQDHTAQARALQDLEAQRLKAESLRRVTGDWLIRITRTGIIQDMQPPAAPEFAGYGDMFAGKHLEDVFQGDDVAPLVAAAEAVIENSEVQELSFTRQSGQELAVRIATFAEDTVLLLLRDTTELKEATAQLAESESTNQAMRAHLAQVDSAQAAVLARQRALDQVIGDLVLRLQSDGTVVDAQDSNAGKLVQTPAFRGKPVRDVLPGPLAEAVHTAAVQALASGTVQEFVCTLEEDSTYQGSLAACGDNEVIALVRDVSQVQRATAQLTQAETSLQALRTLLPDLLLRLQADGTILECKPAANFGPRAVAELVGARVREVLPVDLASQVMAAIAQVQRDGRPSRFTCHPAGGQVLAGGMAALAADQFLCVVRDLTQQKQMETALAQQAAVLAKEMQAKIEEESLRSLRTENDILRAKLMRVAQVALEGDTGTVPTKTATPTESTHAAGASEAGGAPSGPAQGDGAENAAAEPAPPKSQQEAAASPDSPSAPAPQAAVDPDAHTPNLSEDSPTPENGDPAKRGAEARIDVSPTSSGSSPAVKTSTQTQTIVATQRAAQIDTKPTENGQAESDAMTNGNPAEETRKP